MRCPRCDAEFAGVIDSGIVENGKMRFRRRECSVCKYRFFTVELPLVDGLEDEGRWWADVVERGLRLASEKDGGDVSPCPFCGGEMKITTDPWGLDCSAGCGMLYRPQKKVRFTSSVFAVDSLVHDWNLLIIQLRTRAIRDFIRNEKERRKPKSVR